MFQRPHIKELTARIIEPRKHIQVVSGLSVEEFLKLNPITLF